LSFLSFPTRRSSDLAILCCSFSGGQTALSLFHISFAGSFLPEKSIPVPSSLRPHILQNGYHTHAGSEFSPKRADRYRAADGRTGEDSPGRFLCSDKHRHFSQNTAHCIRFLSRFCTHRWPDDPPGDNFPRENIHTLPDLVHSDRRDSP